MDDKYISYARFFKALADPNRLMIVDMLSCGELCACVILEKFRITQPTLSHHMGILCDCGLVKGRRDGKWTHYSINDDIVQNLIVVIKNLTSETSDCICMMPKYMGDMNDE